MVVTNEDLCLVGFIVHRDLVLSVSGSYDAVAAKKSGELNLLGAVVHFLLNLGAELGESFNSLGVCHCFHTLSF